MEGLMILGIIVLYYFLGAILNGLMHRWVPGFFTNDDWSVGLVVMAWIVVLPLYWFAIFCDRCIVWFEKKK